MERTVANVPPAHRNFVIALLRAEGLSEISETPEPDGEITITGRKPAASPAAPASAFGDGISDRGVELMLDHEAFIPFRYQDIGDNATIGYGHHKGLTAAQIDAAFPGGLTEDEAWHVFRTDVAEAEGKVARAVKTALAQHQRDALVTVAFWRGNVNAEAPLANAGNHAGVADSIARITTSGGKFSQGVANRSAMLAAMYRHAIYPSPGKTRAQHKEAGLKLIRDRYPNKLNGVGNKFGRPTEASQKKQAEDAFFRMTGETL